MANVSIFDLVKTISKESISHPDVGAVKTTAGEVAESVKDDVEQELPDEEVDAEVSNTKTMQPGPKDGGGTGKAENVDAGKVKTSVSVKDLKIEADQNGGREIDVLPNKVNVKDGLSGSDVSHSVENHDSEESTLKTIETGGAEAVGEADDLVMDIDAEAEDGAVAGILSQSETDEKVMGKILNEIGELENASAAVEGYINLMKRMEKNGCELSNELRESISIGLKTISQELFESEIITLEEYRVSNEANDVALTDNQLDDTEFDGARDKTSKGLSGKLKQIWEAIKRAYNRSLSSLIDLWQSFTTDTTKIKKHLEDLRSRVKVLEGGKEIRLANSTRLMIGEEFVGNSPEAIKRVTSVGKELLLDWPSSLAKILEAVDKNTGLFKTGSFDEVVTHFEKAIDGAFKGLKKLNPSDKGKVPSGFLDSESVSWSDVLPGNRSLYVGFKRHGGADGLVKDIVNFKDTVNINFSAVPEYETSTGEAHVVSLDSSEALTVIKSLLDMVNMIQGRSEGMSALRKMANTLKSQTTMNYIMGDNGGAGIYNLILANNVGQATVSSEHAFVGYLISMIKAYIGFIEGSLRQEVDGDVIDA